MPADVSMVRTLQENMSSAQDVVVVLVNRLELECRAYTLVFEILLHSYLAHKKQALV